METWIHETLSKNKLSSSLRKGTNSNGSHTTSSTDQIIESDSRIRKVEQVVGMVSGTIYKYQGPLWINGKVQLVVINRLSNLEKYHLKTHLV